MWFVLDAALVAAGYAASIYSWPPIKVWLVGAAKEAAALRQRSADLEARIRRL
jgi:hypothetical protein